MPKQPKSSEKTLQFLFQPHSITVLACLFAASIYFAWNDYDSRKNLQLGLAAGAIVMLALGLLMFKNGPFIRPHAAFWRLILAASAVYQLALTFLLFQAQFDEFVIAHVVGWFCKALMLRSYAVLWILSIAFELLEYSLQHQLPNFAECWWDHWILDVLVCNWLGLYLGMKTCEVFEMRTYSWRGIHEIPSVSGKMRRVVQQFTPYSWTKFEWSASKDFKHFCTTFILIIVLLQAELNAFYLKFLLYIPASNPLNAFRLGFMFLAATPAIAELYEYLVNPSVVILGAHAWLMIANVMTETLICFKFGRGVFQTPFPRYVIWGWIFGGGLLIGYVVVRFFLPAILHLRTTHHNPRINSR